MEFRSSGNDDRSPRCGKPLSGPEDILFPTRPSEEAYFSHEQPAYAHKFRAPVFTLVDIPLSFYALSEIALNKRFRSRKAEDESYVFPPDAVASHCFRLGLKRGKHPRKVASLERVPRVEGTTVQFPTLLSLTEKRSL